MTKKFSIILLLLLAYSPNLYSACTVIGDKKYGDCDHVIIDRVPENIEPKEISGTFTSVVRGDAFIKRYTRMYGSITGNLVVHSKGRAVIYGYIDGNVVNYGSIYLYGSIGGYLLNHTFSEATIDGVVDGELMGDNFEIKSGSFINGKVYVDGKPIEQ